ESRYSQSASGLRGRFVTAHAGAGRGIRGSVPTRSGEFGDAGREYVRPPVGGHAAAGKCLPVARAGALIVQAPGLHSAALPLQSAQTYNGSNPRVRDANIIPSARRLFHVVVFIRRRTGGAR